VSAVINIASNNVKAQSVMLFSVSVLT